MYHFLSLIDSPNTEKEECQSKHFRGYQITFYLSLVLLSLLLFIELLQFISKLIGGELLEYFGVQNTIELLMFSFTIALFVYQWNEDVLNKDDEKSGLQEHFLGWALFLAWMDLTIFLGKMDFFGRHIYMSWQIMRNVAWSLAVFIPSLVAFAFGFHSFLYNNYI